MINDTIAAIATPLGTGAVAMIRVSGKDAIEVLQPLVSKDLSTLEDRKAILVTLKDTKTREILDQVLLTPFLGDKSFTGEPVLEIATHGGALVTQRVLEAIIASGARPADAGEFSQRAFVNGKLDLTQAEAIMDLISAQTDLAMQAAHHQLEGRLSGFTENIRTQIIALAAQLEAYIDFPEEDISPETESGWLQRIEALLVDIDSLLKSAEQGRLIREGIRTVIYGKPNAGKSSLLNSLLGYDRAIVSDVLGTTRDTLEEVINLRGLPIRLIDTAGVRDSSDQIEKLGIERTEQELNKADLLIHIVDGTESALVSESEPLAKRVIKLANKSDQPAFKSQAGSISISCATGDGIEALEQAIFDAVITGGQLKSADMTAINQRHQGCLINAKKALEAAKAQIQNHESPEFVSLDLREAIESIGAIAGQIDTEDILGEIFSSFCIGK